MSSYEQVYEQHHTRKFTRKQGYGYQIYKRGTLRFVSGYFVARAPGKASYVFAVQNYAGQEVTWAGNTQKFRFMVVTPDRIQPDDNMEKLPNGMEFAKAVSELLSQNQNLIEDNEDIYNTTKSELSEVEQEMIEIPVQDNQAETEGDGGSAEDEKPSEHDEMGSSVQEGHSNSDVQYDGPPQYDEEQHLDSEEDLATEVKGATPANLRRQGRASPARSHTTDWEMFTSSTPKQGPRHCIKCIHL